VSQYIYRPPADLKSEDSIARVASGLVHIALVTVELSQAPARDKWVHDLSMESVLRGGQELEMGLTPVIYGTTGYVLQEFMHDVAPQFDSGKTAGMRESLERLFAEAEREE
jgi:hypothetical protein